MIIYNWFKLTKNHFFLPSDLFFFCKKTQQLVQQTDSLHRDYSDLNSVNKQLASLSAKISQKKLVQSPSIKPDPYTADALSRLIWPEDVSKLLPISLSDLHFFRNLKSFVNKTGNFSLIPKWKNWQPNFYGSNENSFYLMTCWSWQNGEAKSYWSNWQHLIPTFEWKQLQPLLPKNIAWILCIWVLKRSWLWRFLPTNWWRRVLDSFKNVFWLYLLWFL